MKAQLTLEFALISGIALTLLIGSLVVTRNIYEDTQNTRIQAELPVLTKNIQREITLAQKLSEGYQRTITIPSQVRGQQVNITQGAGTRYYFTVNVDGVTSTRPIPPINGTLTTGTNTIRNQGGTLSIQ